jgi:hypothetical protein
MEIHRPRASHSWREFLIEIGTITIGILIALGLESLILTARDHRLVNNARADLRSELRDNRRELAGVIEAASSSATTLRALIDDAELWLQTGSDAAQSRIELRAKQLRASVSPLSTAAWEAAGASEAVVHMPLREAQALAKVYSSSRVFNGLEDRVEEHWFEVSGLPSTLKGMERSQIASGVAQLKVLLSYQLTIVAAGDGLLKEYDATLAVLGAD